MAESVRGNGISDNFCKNFKNSKFYEVYENHTDELFIGVRDGYINIYYKCANIAKIDTSNDNELKGELSAAYCDLIDDKATILMNDNGFKKNYDIIKRLVNNREKKNYEKASQERLVLDNNNNPNSDWYCLDLEYAKTGTDWRFDIIAISKSSPHKVALIELKYGAGAIKGPSGIQSHIEDYYSFDKKKSYEKMKDDIINIINIQEKLGVPIPGDLKSIKVSDLANTPNYYFITLNNNKKSPNASSPKMSMGGYLFTKKERWGTKRLSTTNVAKYEKMVFELKPTFLFSSAVINDKGLLSKKIDDILSDKCYDEVEKF